MVLRWRSSAPCTYAVVGTLSVYTHVLYSTLLCGPIVIAGVSLPAGAWREERRKAGASLDGGGTRQKPAVEVEVESNELGEAEVEDDQRRRRRRGQGRCTSRTGGAQKVASGKK